jgi:hypothetical protein
MGIIEKPPNLSIVTEYLPNGSLYQLLHQSKKDVPVKNKVSDLFR